VASRILNPWGVLILAMVAAASPLQADAEDAVADAVRHIWHDQKQIVTAPLRTNRVDAIVWGTMGASILYLAPRWGNSRSVDERFEQGLDRNNASVDHFLKGFTHVGDSPVLFGMSVVGYGVGRLEEWPRVRIGSLHAFEGLMDAGIAAEIIKMTAGRRRPVDNPSHGPFLGPRGYFSDYGDDSSFVSGHAAMTFALATVISHESHSYWVGVPAYVVAGGISYSRIYVERHWLSDVIGGAVLGYSVGILVEHRRHSKPQLAGTFYPVVDNNTIGLAWRGLF